VTKLRNGRLLATLSAAAVLIGLAAAPAPDIAQSAAPEYARQDTPTFSPAVRTLIAGGAPSNSAKESC
jgi:hypothetical protein